MFTEKSWSYFYEIYEALPRQGPGDRESTIRALGMLPALTGKQRILDIGCGSGAQTLDLARATKARIIAMDNHPAFIARLSKSIQEFKLEGRITAQVGDMNDLNFPDGSFDVIWSEGSIFIIGFAKGLAKWRRLLPPGGHMAVSEFCWLRENPAAELRDFLANEGADAGNAAARRAAIAASGYQLIGDFVLPAVGWWENYYVPLAERLKRFREKYPDDPEAQVVASRSQQEIDLYLKYPGAFGYIFFIMRRS